MDGHDAHSMMVMPKPTSATTSTTSISMRQRRSNMFSLFSDHASPIPVSALSTPWSTHIPTSSSAKRPLPAKIARRESQNLDDDNKEHKYDVPKAIYRHKTTKANFTDTLHPSSSSSSSTSASSSHSSSSSSSNSSSTSLPSSLSPSFYASLHQHSSALMLRVSQTSSADDTLIRKAFNKFQRKPKQRVDLLRNQVLPWFRKSLPTTTTSLTSNTNLSSHVSASVDLLSRRGSRNEKEAYVAADDRLGLFLRWWAALLETVQQVRYTERGIYFECILEIMGRHEFMEYDSFVRCDYTVWITTNKVTALEHEYRQRLDETLRYTFDRLNQKAIYSNTISFCAKVLALGFFKIPGLAMAMLLALPQRLAMFKPICSELESLSTSFRSHCDTYKAHLYASIPAHLHPLMVSDLRSYKRCLEKSKTVLPPMIDLTGNWVRRWQSDDSELFFSYYRHYHSILKMYISAHYFTTSSLDLARRNALLAVSPGYVYFASYFASKIDALLHQQVRSVTTVFQFSDPALATPRSSTPSPPPLPFQSGKRTSFDEDNLHQPLIASFASCSPHMAQTPTPTGKPKLLDMATHRYAQCMMWCIVAADPDGLFHDMINVWLRAVIKKTSLARVESVFCLLDFIDVCIVESRSFKRNTAATIIDLPFLLHTLHIMLARSDHTITLVRALSFIYAHFSFLTPQAALLDLLCNRILLEPRVFERLFLHWGRNVRIFFLRCLVWRVGRVWSQGSIRWSREDELPRRLSGISDQSLSCDGNRCQQVWQTNHRTLPVISSEPNAYAQCTLETHLVLEALLVSFYRQHARLQQGTKGGDLKGVPSVSPSMEPLPDRFPPRPRSCLITCPVAPPVVPSESTHDLAYRRHKTTSLFKKHQHILVRSLGGKDGRLNRLFMSQGPSTSSPTFNASFHGPLCNQIYTIPGPYCCFPPNHNLNHQDRSGGTCTLHPCHSDSESHRSKQSHQSSQSRLSSTSSDSHYTAMSTSSTSSTSSSSSSCSDVSGDDELDDAKVTTRLLSAWKQTLDKNAPHSLAHKHRASMNGPLRHGQGDPGHLTTRTLSTVVAAQQWQYAASMHIYASKTVAEVNSIVQEYDAWLQKVPHATTSSMIPIVSLDWPKNWSSPPMAL